MLLADLNHFYLFAYGYKLGMLVITDERSKDISFTDNKDGTYIFTMPDSKVNISPTFVKTENPFTDVSTGENRTIT